jgi:diguanylate cyclase (GGDEF)-like protein
VDIRTIRYQLTNDFQLAIVTLLGAIALLGISPFIILRAINGQWVPFAVDLLIQTGILGSVLHAWRSGSARSASFFLAYFIGIMATVAVHILGAPGVYWFYPAIVANFFLVDRRHALAIALLGLLVIVLDGRMEKSTTESASFLITVIVCALLSYAFAFRTAVQRVQLETLATKDALTGVFNRRTLLEELERARRTFERERRSCGMLVLDLDHFKQINDRHGHLAGDQVLINFARLLERHVRLADRIFRFGGEEFVILVPGANHASLVSMAEKLRRKLEDNTREAEGHWTTASIGGAMLRSGESHEDWFARADAALYAAKTAGRNRTIVDPET